jgi:hypothetical protein
VASWDGDDSRPASAALVSSVEPVAVGAFDEDETDADASSSLLLLPHPTSPMAAPAAVMPATCKKHRLETLLSIVYLLDSSGFGRLCSLCLRAS